MKFKDAQRRVVTMLDSKEFKERVAEEDPTMEKHIPALKTMNAGGYLTFNSQAGRHYKGKSQEGKSMDIMERAYIMGYMMETDAATFIQNMGVATDKNAVFVAVGPNDIYIPSALDIPLTVTTIDGKQSIHTHTSLTVPRIADDSFRKMANLNKSEKAVLITCWDPVWGRAADGKHGLFTDVLHILNM